jgi:hypothetical protein
VQLRTNHSNPQQAVRCRVEYVNIYEAGVKRRSQMTVRAHRIATAIAVVGTLTVAMTNWSFAAPTQYRNYSAGQGYASEQYCYLPSEPCDNQHTVTN